MSIHHRVVAWLCIFSTLMLGCYSTQLISPTGDDKDKLYTSKVDYVVTKDGTKYDFEKPPAIVSDTLVGVVNINVPEGIMKKQVAVPVSDVVKAGVSEFSATKTLLLVVGLAGVVALIYAAIFYDTGTDLIDSHK